MFYLPFVAYFQLAKSYSLNGKFTNSYVQHKLKFFYCKIEVEKVHEVMKQLCKKVYPWEEREGKKKNTGEKRKGNRKKSAERER